MVDLEYLTTSGRVNAPDTPETQTPLDELSVAELGSCYVNEWALTCPEQESKSCPHSYIGVAPLQDYDLEMLAVYPECEVCECMLVVVP